MPSQVYDLIGPDCPEGSATMRQDTLDFEGLTVDWEHECGATSDGKALFRVCNEDGPTKYMVADGRAAHPTIPGLL